MNPETLKAYIDFYERENTLINKSKELVLDALMWLRLLKKNNLAFTKDELLNQFYEAHKKYGNTPNAFLENAQTLPDSETVNNMRKIIDMAINNHEVIAIVEPPQTTSEKDKLLQHYMRNEFDEASDNQAQMIIESARVLGYNKFADEMQNDLTLGK